MAFLDDLSRTLTDMGKEVAQKTKDVVDVLQLKTQINSEKSRLRDLYAEIGKSYYEQYTDQARLEYEPACERIQSSLDKIAEMEAKISRMENARACSSCSAPLGKSAAFCSKCGASVMSDSWGVDRDVPVPGQRLLEVGYDEPDEFSKIFEEETELGKDR